MSNILTPISLWSNFDVSLDIKAEIKSEVISQGVKIEKITFLGRDTGNGRVKIAAAFASEPQTPVAGTVLIMPDSTQTIDEGLLKFIVKHGYAALMVDYRVRNRILHFPLYRLRLCARRCRRPCHSQSARRWWSTA